MPHFRDLIERLADSGELLRVKRAVDPRFEIAALLQQAEARRKAILFESISGNAFRVIGGLLTTPQRMALALGHEDVANFTREDHAELVRRAIAAPVPATEVDSGPCKEVAAVGADVDCGRLPVPTFFADDSGPFLTAAVGISRNPSNGVINVGIYRILMLGDNRVAVSASPSSDLFRFLRDAAGEGDRVRVALVIGPDPALLMAAAAKVPVEVSELDVAGALAGAPLELVSAETSDLLVPAHAEFVLEVDVDPSETVMNRMGEFGDFYGEQNAPVAEVTAITHRRDAIFHTVMAGAGREHNSIGKIILGDIEPMLRGMLAETHPAVGSARVYFEPPRMGVLGDIYLQLADNADIDIRQLVVDVFNARCGIFDIARVIRRVIVVDSDIDIRNRREVDWAVSTRANTPEQVWLFDDLEVAGGKLRIGINATANPGELEQFRRLIVPGSDSVRLDDYLDGSGED